jgi:hypothetical protein
MYSKEGLQEILGYAEHIHEEAAGATPEKSKECLFKLLGFVASVSQRVRIAERKESQQKTGKILDAETAQALKSGLRKQNKII